MNENEKLKARVAELEKMLYESLPKSKKFAFAISSKISNTDKYNYITDEYEHMTLYPPFPDKPYLRDRIRNFAAINDLIRIVATTTVMRQRENQPGVWDGEYSIPKLSEIDKKYEDLFVKMAEEVIEVLYKYKKQYHEMGNAPAFVQYKPGQNREAE